MQEESENFFFVEVFSNSNSKDSSNTTISFVNTLARPLYLNPEDEWCIGLHGLTCNNKFFVRSVKDNDELFYSQEQVEKDSNLSQILVKCDQIQQKFDGRKLISVHSRTPYNKISNRIHNFEPRNILFFPVNCSVISEIGISLWQPNLKKLFLRPGQVTTVSLKFQKMGGKREKLTPVPAETMQFLCHSYRLVLETA